MSTRRRVIEISMFVAGFLALVFFLPTGHRPSAGALARRAAETASASDRTSVAANQAAAIAGHASDGEGANGPISSSLFATPLASVDLAGFAPIAGVDATSVDGGGVTNDVGPAAVTNPGPRPAPAPSPAPTPQPAPAPSPSPSPAPSPTPTPGSPKGGTSGPGPSQGSGSTPGGSGSGTTTTSTSTSTTTTTTTTRPPNTSGSTPGGKTAAP